MTDARDARLKANKEIEATCDKCGGTGYTWDGESEDNCDCGALERGRSADADALQPSAGPETGR